MHVVDCFTVYYGFLLCLVFGTSSSQRRGLGSGQSVDFDCPEEFGYYPHPSDCTQYYVCVFGGALLESCTGGLMYSHELQTCDWPRNVGCGENSAGEGGTISTVRVTDPRTRGPIQIRTSSPTELSVPSRSAAQLQRQQQQQQQPEIVQPVQKQPLYDEEDLGPAEEIESDRQQRVYRGQPSTIGQVQRDRDGLRSVKNSIPAQNVISGQDKIALVSYGSQRVAQPKYEDQYRIRTTHVEPSNNKNRKIPVFLVPGNHQPYFIPSPTFNTYIHTNHPGSFSYNSQNKDRYQIIHENPNNYHRPYLNHSKPNLNLIKLTKETIQTDFRPILPQQSYEESYDDSYEYEEEYDTYQQPPQPPPQKYPQNLFESYQNSYKQVAPTSQKPIFQLGPSRITSIVTTTPSPTKPPLFEILRKKQKTTPSFKNFTFYAFADDFTKPTSLPLQTNDYRVFTTTTMTTTTTTTRPVTAKPTTTTVKDIPEEFYENFKPLMPTYTNIKTTTAKTTTTLAPPRKRFRPKVKVGEFKMTSVVTEGKMTTTTMTKVNHHKTTENVRVEPEQEYQVQVTTPTPIQSRPYNSSQRFQPQPPQYNQYYQLYEEEGDLYSNTGFAQPQRQYVASSTPSSPHRGQTTFKQQSIQIEPQQPTYQEQDLYSPTPVAQDYNEQFEVQIDDQQLNVKPNRSDSETVRKDTQPEGSISRPQLLNGTTNFFDPSVLSPPPKSLATFLTPPKPPKNREVLQPPRNGGNLAKNLNNFDNLLSSFFQIVTANNRFEEDRMSTMQPPPLLKSPQTILRSEIGHISHDPVRMSEVKTSPTTSPPTDPSVTPPSIYPELPNKEFQTFFVEIEPKRKQNGFFITKPTTTTEEPVVLTRERIVDGDSLAVYFNPRQNKQNIRISPSEGSKNVRLSATLDLESIERTTKPSSQPTISTEKMREMTPPPAKPYQFGVIRTDPAPFARNPENEKRAQINYRPDARTRSQEQTSSEHSSTTYRPRFKVTTEDERKLTSTTEEDKKLPRKVIKIRKDRIRRPTSQEDEPGDDNDLQAKFRPIVVNENLNLVNQSFRFTVKEPDYSIFLPKETSEEKQVVRPAYTPINLDTLESVENIPPEPSTEPSRKPSSPDSERNLKSSSRGRGRPNDLKPRLRHTTVSPESQASSAPSLRHRGGSSSFSLGQANENSPNRGTTATSSRGTRPTLKPSTSIVSKASEFIDVYRYPPRRPRNLYATPTPDKGAAKCRRDVCLLPDCNCGGKEIPGGLAPEETPQLVLLTFDDSVNDLNKGLYEDLFERGRVNPNGCPISATFYVSHEWTDYAQVQNLYANGHEMASHSVSHSFGEQFSQKKWTREIAGQREIIAAYGGVRLEDVRGMRAPFLAVGGNKMFKMLYDANFTYDSSMPIYENKPPSWPYTMDYKIHHDCMIPPCPTKSYPGVWEVPMVMWQDLNGGRCSMGDACSNPPTADGVYKMLIKNFERHFTSNRAPFGLFYHAAWFTHEHHKEGFIAFLDTIVAMPEVWLVTNWQAIQWMRDPQPISRVNSFQPFQCNEEKAKKCNNPKVCNLWHKSGVRYMRTCQPCPDVYPWTGKTGVRNSRVDNEIIDE